MILKKVITEKAPEVGDYKITYHYAYLPKTIDGFKIWLEGYKKVYEWKRRGRTIILGGKCFPIENCGDWDLIAEQRINNK